MLKKIESIIILINNMAIMASMALLAGLMIFTTVDVVGRFIGHPVSGSYQISELILVWVICLAWPFTTGTKGHVRVEILISKFSPPWKKMIELLTNILLLMVFFLIAWKGVEMVQFSVMLNDLVSIIDVPLYPFQVVVPLAAILVCPILLVQSLKLFTKKEDVKE